MLTSQEFCKALNAPCEHPTDPGPYTTAHGVTALPSKMVTHNWSNLFTDLIAGVVADALGEKMYDQVAAKLAKAPRIILNIEHFRADAAAPCC